VAGMNSPIITMMPILCDEKKLDQKELVEQINYLQDAILRQDSTLLELSVMLAKMNHLANILNTHLYVLLDSFEENDDVAISVYLKKLSDLRKSAGKVKVH
jgi:uncharacterized coiled-coil protein SlyX